MNSAGKNQLRRRSMLGTALFALGIVATVAFAMTRSVWLAGAALVFLGRGVMLLYQVGKSLS